MFTLGSKLCKPKKDGEIHEKSLEKIEPSEAVASVTPKASLRGKTNEKCIISIINYKHKMRLIYIYIYTLVLNPLILNKHN